MTRKPPAPTPPVFITLPEAAKRTGRSLTNIHKHANAGRLRTTEVESPGPTRLRIVSLDDLDAFESTQRRTGRPRGIPLIRFKAEYVPLILSGKKTQTMRAKSPSTIVPGVTVNAVCRYGEPPFAQLVVTEVEQLRIDHLDDRDARADGFASVEDLQRAIATTYPGADTVIVIRFRRVQP